MMEIMKLMHDSIHQSYYQGRGRGRGRAQGIGQRRYGGRGRGEQSMGGGNYGYTHGNYVHLESACITPGPTHKKRSNFCEYDGGE